MEFFIAIKRVTERLCSVSLSTPPQYQNFQPLARVSISQSYIPYLLDHRLGLLSVATAVICSETCFFLLALPQAARAASHAQWAACLVAAHSAQAH